MIHKLRNLPFLERRIKYDDRVKGEKWNIPLEKSGEQANFESSCNTLTPSVGMELVEIRRGFLRLAPYD